MSKRKIEVENNKNNSKLSKLNVANLRKLLNNYIKIDNLNEFKSLLRSYVKNKLENKKNSNFMKIFAETLSLKISNNSPYLALVHDYPLKTILSFDNCHKFLIALGEIYEEFNKDKKNEDSGDFYTFCFLNAVLYDKDGVYIKNYHNFFQEVLTLEKLEKHLTVFMGEEFNFRDNKFDYLRFVTVISDFKFSIDWLKIILPKLTQLSKTNEPASFKVIDHIFKYLETKVSDIQLNSKILFWNEIVKHTDYFQTISSALNLFCMDDAFVQSQIDNGNFKQKLFLYGSKELIVNLSNKFDLLEKINLSYILDSLEFALKNNLIKGEFFFNNIADIIQYIYIKNPHIKIEEFERLIDILNLYFVMTTKNYSTWPIQEKNKFEEMLASVSCKMTKFLQSFGKEHIISEQFFIRYEERSAKEDISRNHLFSLNLLNAMDIGSPQFNNSFTGFLDRILLYFRDVFLRENVYKDANNLIYDRFFEILSQLLNKYIITTARNNTLLRIALMAYGFYKQKQFDRSFYDVTILGFKEFLTNVFAKLKIDAGFFIHCINILLGIYKASTKNENEVLLTLYGFIDNFAKEADFYSVTSDDNALPQYKELLVQIQIMSRGQVKLTLEQYLIKIFQVLTFSLAPDLELFIGEIGRFNYNANPRCELIHRFFMESEQYKKFYEPKKGYVLHKDINPLQTIASNSQAIHISSVEVGCLEIADFVIKRYLDDSLKPKDNDVFLANVKNFSNYLYDQASKIFYDKYWQTILESELQNHPNLQVIASFSAEVKDELLNMFLKKFRNAFFGQDYVRVIDAFPFNTDNNYYHAIRCSQLLYGRYSNMIYGPWKLKPTDYLKLICQAVSDLEFFPDQNTLHQRYEILVSTLAMAMREYNRELKTDKTAEDIPRCPKGLIEDILSCLGVIHPRFKVEVINAATIKDQFIEFYQIKFLGLADNLKQQAIENNLLLSSSFLNEFKQGYYKEMEKYLEKGYITNEDIEFYFKEKWEISYFPLIESYVKSQQNNNNSSIVVLDPETELKNDNKENPFRFFVDFNLKKDRRSHFFKKIDYILNKDNTDVFASLEGMIKITGFDINTTDSQGQTGLHLAVKANNVALVKFLVDHKIDIYKLDQMNKTAADYIHPNSDKHICELLKQPLQKITI